jgi:hypothetical protein
MNTEYRIKRGRKNYEVGGKTQKGGPIHNTEKHKYLF